jgi:hypothetical protein
MNLPIVGSVASGLGRVSTRSDMVAVARRRTAAGHRQPVQCSRRRVRRKPGSRDSGQPPRSPATPVRRRPFAEHPPPHNRVRPQPSAQQRPPRRRARPPPAERGAASAVARPPPPEIPRDVDRDGVDRWDTGE